MKIVFCILLLLPLIVFAQTNNQYIEQDRPLNLVEGWNMIGFTCNEPINVIDEFLPIYLIWTASYLSFLQFFRFDSVCDLFSFLPAPPVLSCPFCSGVHSRFFPAFC